MDWVGLGHARNEDFASVFSKRTVTYENFTLFFSAARFHTVDDVMHGGLCIVYNRGLGLVKL